ncbi:MULTISPECIES: alpha/beta fold hydrolase [Streptomyces]|uniref:alpha/beta fold hydrolase n=1 Tax=Streptomyces TaxID=1883 RepID=UPI00048FD6BB|nr:MULTISPECIES: alpha/beta hydrolase [unclassified Streptomyces]MYY16809.1 alpha/beta fold hydrolase [Streptomyces sp. SID4912]WSX35886.1 alpha/beta hydrolase [Streptomyces halstedii]SCD34974.1 Pimeloyl-ACP methyl ester carboxylesterase [Streptomyces sp. DpondAA-D4]
MTDWILDRTFDSSSGEVRWAALGPEEAPPVVLVHGTPFSSYVWRGIARALAQDHRVYVWDLPGYGTSAQYDGQDVSLRAQGRVLAELTGHWGLSGPAVVAHDFGGCVALRARLLHGVRYSRLALVDPVALAPWGSPVYRLFGGRPEVFGALPPDLHRALVREYVGSASHLGLRPAVLDRLTGPWCTESGQPAFYRQIAQNDQRFTDEIQDRYGELDLPVLICWGTEDTWIPVARAHELAALIPDARLQLIDGAGHLVQEDAPAELTAALTRFLRTAP